MWLLCATVAAFRPGGLAPRSGWPAQGGAGTAGGWDWRGSPARPAGGDAGAAPPPGGFAEAAQMMETHKINALLVLDAQQRVVGALNIHDLLRARVV